jgi:small-conductance mechanosensitive channel
MPLWQRLIIVAAVIAFSMLLAKLIDWRLKRKPLAPGAETRYRVLRRSVMFGIVAVGILSSLLVIPQVRAVAGGLLASSAVLGLVIGFAAQRTLANFVAGILIAFSQPLRLGDRVTVDGVEGVVEEIGLTYTFIRVDDNTRFVIPNEKLASDTIRNSTIVSRETVAQITVQVPLSTDLESAVDLLRQEVASDQQGSAYVSELSDHATITVSVLAPDATTAEQLESDLRLRAHARLRAAGLWNVA